MKNVFIFLAEGFEEIEAIATIDVLRRGEVDITTVSVSKDLKVTGAHGIPVHADKLFEDVDFSDAEMLILPGGMPGASNLNAHNALKELISHHAEKGGLLAAICAAPLVFGGLGILEGKKATCYPGFESQLTGAKITNEPVVQDGNIITGKGPGFAVNFGLKIVTELKGKEKADAVAAGMLI